ncbi:hypothetical protein [Polyangium spumosum]|uniref:DUF4189 domain-containing protein n=1 Tax=Polyangium spumosum TaxID=889282 RepID=A0A6N7PSH5_9BACT|nr:hypothetical protein [Polyangium spumosum]MRG93195.1 hypothetical protein [Polyangium spumosum]
MRSLFAALTAGSILVLFASTASAGGVENLPSVCESGIGATGFQNGTRAQYRIVMLLWRNVYRADYFRANQFIDNVTSTVLAARPTITPDQNAFVGCRFIGMIDGATRAISEIAENQLIMCTNDGLNIGHNAAALNCALMHTIQQMGVVAGKSYVVMDIECSVNVSLGCRTGFDRYLRDNEFGICAELSSSPDLGYIKNESCSMP